MKFENNILIPSAGIAGLTTAYRMKQFGFHPVIIEQELKLRTSVYMINFWGIGNDIAERMNIIEQLRKKHYEIPRITFVNKSGKRVGGFNIKKLRKVFHYRHFNMLSGNTNVLAPLKTISDDP